MNQEDQTGLIIGLSLAAAAYFLPTICAILRRHPSGGGIFALNLFLGWTFIGWLAALVWSLSSTKVPQQTVIVNNLAAGNDRSAAQPSQPAMAYPVAHPIPQSLEMQCPTCAETIKAAARKCRFCGESFATPLLPEKTHDAEWEEVKTLPAPAKESIEPEAAIGPSQMTREDLRRMFNPKQHEEINPWLTVLVALVLIGILVLLSSI